METKQGARRFRLHFGFMGVVENPSWSDGQRLRQALLIAVLLQLGTRRGGMTGTETSSAY